MDLFNKAEMTQTLKTYKPKGKHHQLYPSKIFSSVVLTKECGSPKCLKLLGQMGLFTRPARRLKLSYDNLGGDKVTVSRYLSSYDGYEAESLVWWRPCPAGLGSPKAKLKELQGRGCFGLHNFSASNEHKD